MKSNPVVFPFVEFQDLSNKKIIKNLLKPKIIDWKEIKNLLSVMKKPNLNLSKRNSVEEKIFDVFLDDNFLFGKKEYVLNYKKRWIEKLNYFTKNQKPIKFTLLGFPFKAPLILKTIRTTPDMGDVLVLNQLKNFVLTIKEIYNPGAIVYIITEGCFGKFTGIRRKKY
jgi:Pyoverdine/dityrosine biosynthesis protein